MVYPREYLADTHRGTFRFTWIENYTNLQLRATMLDEDEWIVLNTPYTCGEAGTPQIAAKLIAQFHDLGPPTNLRELV